MRCKIAWLSILLLPILSYGEQYIRYYPSGSKGILVGKGQSSMEEIPSGFNWYVDSVNGNDSNAGTSQGTALKTIAALLGKTILEGQRIGLARGSTWREQLQVPAAHITVAAYGSGNRPLLDASDAIAAAAWSKTGGRTFVYQADITVVAGGVTQIWAWENDTRLTRKTAADVASVDASAGSFCVSADATGAQTLYVHASDNSNPGANGKTYEFTARPNGLNVDSGTSNVTVTSISARRGNNGDGVIRIAGRNARATNLYGESAHLHVFYFAGNAYAQDIEAYDGGNGMIVYYESNGSPYSFTCVDCYAHNPTMSTTDGSSGISGHTGGGAGNNWAQVTLIRPRVTNTQGCMGGNDVTAMTITSPTCDVGDVGFLTGNSTAGDGVQTTTITGGSVTVQNGAPNRRAIENTGSVNLTITGTTFVSGQMYNAAANNTFNFQNTTWQWSVGYYIQNTQAGTTMTLLNNTYAATAGPTYYMPTAPAMLTSDYNNFTQANANFQLGGSTYASVALWKAGTGQDAHSTP